MVGMEGLGILDDTGEVATASCAWHLPGETQKPHPEELTSGAINGWGRSGIPGSHSGEDQTRSDLGKSVTSSL